MRERFRQRFFGDDTFCHIHSMVRYTHQGALLIEDRGNYRIPEPFFESALSIFQSDFYGVGLRFYKVRFACRNDSVE